MAPPPVLLLLLAVVFLASSRSSSAVECGDIDVPFPFYINSSSVGDAGTPIPEFRLACANEAANSSSPALFLTLPNSTAAMRVIEFLPSGSLILDYSPYSVLCDRWYADFKFAVPALEPSAFFAVTADNVLRLYDCDDSSLCRVACNATLSRGGCVWSKRADLGCCYPLFDGSVWRPGDGLGVFADNGCRGYSSWVESRGVRGIEVEWALPREAGDGYRCADGAEVVNATTVRDGVRCACSAGFLGDGFANGTGCTWDGPGNVQTCCKENPSSRTALLLTGLVAAALLMAAALGLWFLMRQPSKGSKCDLQPACIPHILTKACSCRQFTYEQLHDAATRYSGEQLIGICDGTTHTGVLEDGTAVAVQKVGLGSKHKHKEILERMPLLSQISHRNIARIVGFYSNLDDDALLVVTEHFPCLSLEEHLRREGPHCLGWYHRINIAIEIASAFSYLQSELPSPIFLHELTCGDILLDKDFTAKISGSKLISSALAVDDAAGNSGAVQNFGRLLIELMTGPRNKESDFDAVVSKIKNGKACEIVAAQKMSGKHRPTTQQGVKRVLELAVLCLSSSESGLCIAGASRELMNIIREHIGSSSRVELSLEETFSDSSLLQMISMSPESWHLHLRDC